jgi:hypothetical protein
VSSGVDGLDQLVGTFGADCGRTQRLVAGTLDQGSDSICPLPCRRRPARGECGGAHEHRYDPAVSGDRDFLACLDTIKLSGERLPSSGGADREPRAY